MSEKKGVRFEQRNRVQYQIFETGGERWLYRNRLRIISPWRWTKLRLNPFVGQEFFWEEGRGINQTRLTGGLFLHIHERFKLNFFYMMRHTRRGGDWARQNVFSAHIYLFF